MNSLTGLLGSGDTSSIHGLLSPQASFKIMKHPVWKDYIFSGLYGEDLRFAKFLPHPFPKVSAITRQKLEGRLPRAEKGERCKIRGGYPGEEMIGRIVPL